MSKGMRGWLAPTRLCFALSGTLTLRSGRESYIAGDMTLGEKKYLQKVFIILRLIIWRRRFCFATERYTPPIGVRITWSKVTSPPTRILSAESGGEKTCPMGAIRFHANLRTDSNLE